MPESLLMLGEVVNARTVAGNGGRLWRYGPGYGLGTASPLTIETPDIAPVGEAGTLLARRIQVPIRYSGAGSITLTPIVDFDTELAPTAVQWTAPILPARRVVECYVSRRCTYVRVRIAFAGLTGPVEVYRPTVVGQPLTAADSAVAP